MKISMDSPSVQHLCNADKQLAAVIFAIGEIEYQIHNDGYSFLIHEIIEQMLSIKISSRIYNRLIDKCEGSITPERISQLTMEEITSIGVSKRKAKAISELTKKLLIDEHFLKEMQNCSNDEVITRLKGIYGIGSWTAKMFLIFVLDREDILPFEDGAFLQTYKWLYKTDDIAPDSIKKRCYKWKPYSSVGARYMYRALDMGLISQKQH